MRGQRVVDGDGEPAGGQGPTLDQLADVSLKGEVTSLMLHHMNPIHPLQTHGNMSRGQAAKGHCCPKYPLPEEGPAISLMAESMKQSFVLPMAQTPPQQPRLPSLRSTTPSTDHNSIVMGTVDPQHHSHLGILGPSLGQDCFPFIPHPANKVLKLCFLGDVIEAGRDRHVQGGTRLGEEEPESQAGDVAQLLQCWSTKDEAPGSNSSTA